MMEVKNTPGAGKVYWQASAGGGPATLEVCCYASSACKGDGQHLVRFWVGCSRGKKGKSCAM